MTIKRINRTYRGKQTHSYTIDGQRADGVTTVMSKALPKPALTYWAARCVAEYVVDRFDDTADIVGSLSRDKAVNELKGVPWSQRDEAAATGTEVHDLAERLVKGEEVEVPEQLAGFVDSYVQFLNDWKPRPVLVEATVASRKWMVAGTLDLVADLPNGRRALMDLKTGKGVYPDVALQLAAYRYAEVYLDDQGDEKSMESLGIQDVYVVHVRPERYEVRPVDAGPDAFKVFTHLTWLSRRIGDEMKPWLGEPQLPMGGAQ